ncbi:MAG: hypothetical protein AB7F43_02005 [Bacteriovoracia bacterium]
MGRIQIAGQKRGFRLCNTDRLALSQIAKFGFQTFDELREESLAQVSREHAWHVLKRLTDKKILTVHHGLGKTINGWSISAEGRNSLAKLGLELSVQKAPTYSTTLEHDKLLRDVQKLLLKSPIVANWTTEQELKAKAMQRLGFRKMRNSEKVRLSIPDATFDVNLQRDWVRCALEIELTKKSKSKIYQRLEHHLTSEDFSFVFFVLGNLSVWKIHEEVLAEVQETSNKLKLHGNPNRIYFVEIKNLLEKKLSAVFKSEDHEFCFNDLG